MEYQQITIGHRHADVVKITDLQHLGLYLQNNQNQVYHKFSRLRKSLGPCSKMQFAMNAGMYHADYSPVGLYIEQFKQYQQLNEQPGKGNFFMQPNGVLAWNDSEALVTTTQAYRHSDFKARYATQSGPMLVTDGQINPRFIENSDSLKIRNGVGIKGGELYFVISRNKLNFYKFAALFKQQLGIQNALYLDGSISSAYIPAAHRNDRRYRLGPMVALIEEAATSCEQ
ncbi:phosphodiester glycosidase family protein [Acinetobacter sp. WZC-1]|uniref:phosphodiester glycosidase family protein n=1 Tax=Acinetobacter sp. WZC-1 TaxID=3459034 RepID=UPI00403DD0B8